MTRIVQRPGALITKQIAVCIEAVLLSEDHFVENVSRTGMTGFGELTAGEETAALTRDFQNREFITDFSLSIQQLASFVSRFGGCFARILFRRHIDCDLLCA